MLRRHTLDYVIPTKRGPPQQKEVLVLRMETVSAGDHPFPTRTDPVTQVEELETDPFSEALSLPNAAKRRQGRCACGLPVGR